MYLEGASFKPSVKVLSLQRRNGEAPDLSPEFVFERFPGLESAAAVGLTGSTARGWGNCYSDIDLYAFSDMEIQLPEDETTETWPGGDGKGTTWTKWLGRFGDSRADVTVWPMEYFDAVLAPFNAQDEPEFLLLPDAVADFVYRVGIAIPLKGSEYIDKCRTTLTSSSFGRSRARYSKAVCENRLTDVAGQLDAEDYLGARSSAALAAENVADQALQLAGDLCPGRKWLLRRLESTPACGISVDEYRHEVLNGQSVGERDDVYALRVSDWTRRQQIRLEPATLATTDV